MQISLISIFQKFFSPQSIPFINEVACVKFRLNPPFISRENLGGRYSGLDPWGITFSPTRTQLEG